jgi:hypothetical protein
MPGFKINNEGDGPSALQESVRTHRWKFEFRGGDIGRLNDIAVYASTCQRPSVEVATTIIHQGINQAHFPAKYKWSPINVKFYEIVHQDGGLTTREMFEFWSSKIVQLDNHKIKFPQPAGVTGVVTLLSGTNDKIYTYTLYNVWPSKIDPAEMTYSSSEISTVQVTLTYDAAEEESHGADIAGEVGL